jgi:hypothetical protein
LEKRAEQVLPGSEGDEGEREGVEGRVEVAQAVYVYETMNKEKN